MPTSSTSIEWTKATWNPIVGCTRVSEGCTNCYAERMAKRQKGIALKKTAAGKNPGRHADYINTIDEHARWSGHLTVRRNDLNLPRTWSRPRLIFVNSMSDLFHESLSLEVIQAVFQVMNECPQHYFQVLTKRPEVTAQVSSRLNWTPNIWMGTTVENSRYLERIDYLKQTGAAVKFLSLEPLLGAIPNIPLEGIDWLIAGGESGTGARAMDVSWVRDIRDQCINANVPFFFKQFGKLGNNPDTSDTTAKENDGHTKGGRTLDGRIWDEMPRSMNLEAGNPTAA